MLTRNRIRRAAGTLAFLVGLAGTAWAANEIVLSVTPKAVPTPAFHDRLLPTAPESRPGNAAPIYLRLSYELPDGALSDAGRKAAAWLNQPFDRFPAAETRAFLKQWSPQFRQIEFGARRRACDWDYTLPEEFDDTLSIRLPDVQTMRVWGRILAVKARAEIAEGKYDDAVRTIKTGLAFGRHVAEGPFYINVLVGASVASLMLDRVDELVGRPGAPNLYWALTALPRPLIDMREATEVEWTVAERMVPALAEVDRPRADAEWAPLLARMHAQMVRLEKLLQPDAKATVPADLGAFKTAMLPKAHAYLKARQITATSDDQAVALAVARAYRESYDDHFKRAYLPYPDAAPLEGESDARLAAAKTGPAALFTEILASVETAHAALARLDRKVAALRTVEALRAYAAVHGGRFPDAFDKVRDVAPVPDDPMTGKPFAYRLDGDSAALTGEAPPAFRLVYRISLRK